MKTNKYVVPKAIWGTLIGAGLNFGMGLLNENKQRRFQKEAANLAKKQAKSQLAMQDRSRLKDWEYEGEGEIDYYGAMGGKFANPSKFYATGGDLKQLSSDAVVAEGNKHEESTIDNTSGIKLSAPGKPNFLEVEDDEVINENRVFSDRLFLDKKTSIADIAKKLSKNQGKNEENLNNTDVITKNTAKRNLANIEKNLNKLFFLQEASKEAMGLEDNGNKKVFGGYSVTGGSTGNTGGGSTGGGNSMNFTKSLEKFAPYMDNLTNMFLTANTPKIPEPTIQPIIPLKTRVNVNPQLQDVTRAVEGSTKFIKYNTSDSNAARASITSARLRGGEAKAKIRANKANVEANLYNQNVRNAQGITARNFAKVDDYRAKVMHRSDDIAERISSNISNLSDDITSNRNYKDALRFNQERLDIAKQMYNQGTTRRALLNSSFEIERLKNDPEQAEAILEAFKGTQEEQKLRELLGLDVLKSYAKPSNLNTTI